MHPAGSVLWLRDDAGPFPLCMFAGDNDVVTSGWLAFASTARTEVVLAQASAEEWNEGESGISRVLERVRRELGRTDICAVRLLRVEGLRQAQGLSFQAFLASQQEVVHVYGARSGHGEAKVERQQSFAAFEREGGTILVCPFEGGGPKGKAESAA